MEFDSIYDGYKYSCLLNTKYLVDTYETQENPVEIKLLKNDKYKTILLLVNLSVSDYKALNGTDPIVDYSYLHIMKGIKKSIISGSFEFGDLFELPPVGSIMLTNMITGDPTNEFRGVKLQNNWKAGNPPINAVQFVGNEIKVSNWIKEGNIDLGGMYATNESSLSIISTFVNDQQGTGRWLAGDSLPFSIDNNRVFMDDDQIYVLTLNGTVYDTVMSFSYLKGFVDLSTFDWYQVSQSKRCYEDIRKIVSFSNIKDTITLRKDTIYSEIDEDIAFIKPIDSNYGGGYTIAVDSPTGVSDIIYDNWYSHYKTWLEEEENSWITLKTFNRLSLVVGREININRTVQ